METKLQIWPELGFRDNPYDGNSVIPSNEEGGRLLVGRAAEVESVCRYLSSSAAHPTIEGPNGVGKSSVIAVARHELRQAATHPHAGPLFLPLEHSINVTAETTPEQLTDAVVLECAQAFVLHRETLKAAGLCAPDARELERWLNAPTLKGRGGGVSVLGSGATATAGDTVNAAHGFAASGLRKRVLRGLEECFPSRQSGGFVGVVDNFEVVGPAATRELLDAFRDPFLTLPGLRWILCGARGVLQAASGASRLDGVISEPVAVNAIQSTEAPTVIERRVEVLGLHKGPYAPVEGEGFRYLFDVCRGNLRAAFSQAEKFSLWAVANNRLPDAPEDREELVRGWLADESKKQVSNASGIRRRAWAVFTEIVELGGTALLGDLEGGEGETRSGLRRRLTQLEDASLIELYASPSDKRRKIVQITPRGWLAQVSLGGGEGRS